jgi:hypothetical protein
MRRGRERRRGPIVTGGAWDVPPDWLCAVCGLGGGFAVVLGLLPGAAARSAEGMLARLLFVAAGLFAAGLGAWMGWLRRELLASVRLEELAARAGRDRAELEAALEMRGVAPRFVSNGHAYYDPAEVGDAALLLRPASAPDDASLLRPAAIGERLVRPAAEPTSRRRPASGADLRPGPSSAGGKEG